MGRLLITVGLFFLFSGLVWHFGDRLGLKDLPGNFTFKGDHFILQVPVLTCLIVSVAVSGVMWLCEFLRR